MRFFPFTAFRVRMTKGEGLAMTIENLHSWIKESIKSGEFLSLPAESALDPVEKALLLHGHGRFVQGLGQFLE